MLLAAAWKRVLVAGTVVAAEPMPRFDRAASMDSSSAVLRASLSASSRPVRRIVLALME